jgi:hypothetical protein
VGATINLTTSFSTVTDHDALTVSTARCHRMNCTFKAVECHSLSSLRDLEPFVVFVAADITNSHARLPVSKPTLRAHTCSWPVAPKKGAGGLCDRRSPAPGPVPLGLRGAMTHHRPWTRGASHRVFVPKCNADFALLDRAQGAATVLDVSEGSDAGRQGLIFFCSISRNRAGSKLNDCKQL